MVSLMAQFSGWRFVIRRGWCQNAPPVALTIAYRILSACLCRWPALADIHNYLN
jgi:hypothetical protein